MLSIGIKSIYSSTSGISLYFAMTTRYPLSHSTIFVYLSNLSEVIKRILWLLNSHLKNPARSHHFPFQNQLLLFYAIILFCSPTLRITTYSASSFSFSNSSFANTAIGSATANANLTGTAFPICL